jgi:hypothetical protein
MPLMKLFLTWLLGVPFLVLAMVVARAMTPQGLQLEKPAAVVSASTCVRQAHLDAVQTVVAKNGHRIACQRRTID